MCVPCHLQARSNKGGFYTPGAFPKTTHCLVPNHLQIHVPVVHNRVQPQRPNCTQPIRGHLNVVYSPIIEVVRWLRRNVGNCTGVVRVEEVGCMRLCTSQLCVPCHLQARSNKGGFYTPGAFPKTTHCLVLSHLQIHVPVVHYRVQPPRPTCTQPVPRTFTSCTASIIEVVRWLRRNVGNCTGVVRVEEVGCMRLCTSQIIHRHQCQLQASFSQFHLTSSHPLLAALGSYEMNNGSFIVHSLMTYAVGPYQQSD
jgi:hypothetical protein